MLDFAHPLAVARLRTSPLAVNCTLTTPRRCIAPFLRATLPRAPPRSLTISAYRDAFSPRVRYAQEKSARLCDAQGTMTHYVRGTLEARHPGSDDAVCWLTLCHASGLLLADIFDPQRLSRSIVIGSDCELALELTYPRPETHHSAVDAYWQAEIVDLEWPRPVAGVAHMPLPKPKDREHSVALGPTCVLLRTPFGHMLTTMSQLRYFIASPEKGDLFKVPRGQRLLLLVVL